METITKQKDILNGNEAFLLGVDKSGQQIWLEVLTPTKIKCEALPSDTINLNNLLAKRVFDETNGNYLSSKLNEYAMKINYLRRHPEDKAYSTGIEMQILVKDIIEIIKPTN